jgi:putative peptide zinc metalloprotease protein
MNSVQPRERRKQVRIQRRRDLLVTPQRYEGRTHYVVKDPVRLNYFRLKEQEYFLFERLDGAHTLEDIQKEFEKHYRPRRLSLPEVEAFVRQLVTAGLAHSGSPESGQELHDRWQKGRRRSFLAALGNLLCIRVPLFDPDRVLDRLLPWFGWLFTPGAFVGGLLYVLGALLLIAGHFEVFRARLPTANEFFRLSTVVYLWLAVGIVKVLHEFGHGLSCKKFGGEVHEMGALLLCLSPCLYCNVSDSWMLPSKWRRMAIGLAGVWVELLIASTSTFVWWHCANGTFLHHLCLSLIVVCSVSTLLINGNPLLRYDGYYVLADWLEIPNLHDRARNVVRRFLLETALGVETHPEPAISVQRRLLLGGYAVGAGIYRLVMTYAVLWILFQFLQPYRLGALALAFGVVSVLTLLLRPVVQLGQTIYRYGRVPVMKWPRVLTSGGLVLALGLAFFLLPLPVSRIRQVGLIEVRPDAQAPVYVTTPGTLERLHVREGQHVEAGDLLAEFRSLDVENSRASARSEQEILGVQYQALRELAVLALSPTEKERVSSGLGRTTTDLAHAARQVELLDDMHQRLQLRAPRAGVVRGLPRVDEVGKYWEKGTPTPFCRVGDPDRLWALVPLTPAEYRQLKEQLDAAHHEGRELEVRVRMRGRQDDGWEGVVVQLPESEAEEVPLALTQRAGGPLTAKPGHSPQSAIPQGQFHLVGVAFQAPEGSVAPGGVAQVVVRCEWRSLAWRLWRGLSAAFDLGLL